MKLELADGRVENITADDLVINREERPGLVASSENGVTIALETALTPELEAEGMARELVSKIQNLRKEQKFDVTDRIEISYSAPADVAAMLESFKDYIANEVLAVKFAPGAGNVELDVNVASTSEIGIVKFKTKKGYLLFMSISPYAFATAVEIV